MSIFLQKFPASHLGPRSANLPPIPLGKPRFVYCVFTPIANGWRLSMYNPEPQTYAEALQLKSAFDDDNPNYKRTILSVDENR